MTTTQLRRIQLFLAEVALDRANQIRNSATTEEIRRMAKEDLTQLRVLDSLLDQEVHTRHHVEPITRVVDQLPARTVVLTPGR